MKVAGVIVEYNPFHNGHKYHLEETRRITGADYIVAIMSGNFTQRGIPACFDKYTRTDCALLGGADLVLELPFCYAVGSAEFFAEGAVSILNRLGCVDFLCFGTDASADAALYQETAAFLCEEPEEYRFRLKDYLKQGLSFPAARLSAARGLLREEGCSLLSSPNAILGLEYCKALYRLKSSITPVPIARRGAGYHETALDASGFSSATALRTLLQENTEQGNSGFFDVLPDFLSEKFSSQPLRPLFANDFYPLLDYRLLTIGPELSGIWDVSAELFARMQTRRPPCSYEERLNAIKVKQYTRTRLERCFLHILLGVTREDMVLFRPAAGQCTVYARILGFRRSASPLLKQIKRTAVLPVLTKLGQKEKRCSETELRLLNYDICAADLYARVFARKYGVLLPDEYSYIVIK